MCGTSSLLVEPESTGSISTFKCSNASQIEAKNLTINNSDVANVTLQFENKKIEQLVVETVDTKIIIGKDFVMKKEGDLQTSIGFGHSQDQKVKTLSNAIFRVSF